MANKAVKQGNPKQFIGVLVVVAVLGVGGLGYALTRPGAKPITVDPTIPAGAAEGHLLGKADAPVQVMEFGDFECPHCGDWATVTEPDVRSRLVNTGIISFRYYDFPLAGFKNSWTAHLAASCAEEQGKFWEMHDKLYAAQNEWNELATNNPVKVIRGYAVELGLDPKAWEDCVVTQKPAARIKGNQAEGERRNVSGTPTFVIGDKMLTAISFDQFKMYVDSALAAAKGEASKKPAKPEGAKKSAAR
jgi:protein-disulfide isomerase